MASERKYSEDEVQEIIRLASTPRPAASPQTDEFEPSTEAGLTLAEVQEIAREVGIEPSEVTEAAALLDNRPAAQPRLKHFGIPIGVGRSVDLPRAPTEREWELLVSELRETFHARGRDRSNGNLKSWWNSNLRADVEPTQGGYRLKLRTVKGNALLSNRMGAFAIAAGVLGTFAAMLLVSERDIFPGVMLTAWGSLAIAVNALRQPAWAKRREEQMDYIAARALALIGSGERAS